MFVRTSLKHVGAGLPCRVRETCLASCGSRGMHKDYDLRFIVVVADYQPGCRHGDGVDKSGCDSKGRPHSHRMWARATRLQSQIASPNNHSSQRSGRATTRIQPSTAAYAHPPFPWQSRARPLGVMRTGMQKFATSSVYIPAGAGGPHTPGVWCQQCQCHIRRQVAAAFGCYPGAAVVWTKNNNATFSSSAVLAGQAASSDVS